MPLLMLKEVPRYECLQEVAERVPGADASVCEVFLNILHTGDVASRAETAFLAKHGLNQPRMIILAILDCAEGGALRSSEIAEHANVSRATITGLLDTLEKSGLAAREPDPNDRRASCVRITRAGKALLRKVQPGLLKWMGGILSALSPRECKQLVQLLRKSQQAFAAAQPHRSQGDRQP